MSAPDNHPAAVPSRDQTAERALAEFAAAVRRHYKDRLIGLYCSAAAHAEITHPKATWMWRSF